MAQNGQALVGVFGRMLFHCGKDVLYVEESEIVVPRHFDPSLLLEQHLRSIRDARDIFGWRLAGLFGAGHFDDLAIQSLVVLFLGTFWKVEPGASTVLFADNAHQHPHSERQDQSVRLGAGLFDCTHSGTSGDTKLSAFRPARRSRVAQLAEDIAVQAGRHDD